MFCTYLPAWDRFPRVAIVFGVCALLASWRDLVVNVSYTCGRLLVSLRYSIVCTLLARYPVVQEAMFLRISKREDSPTPPNP